MTLAVMLQGTASDVGKSVLVAGLCRIFHQDGLRTAPFKSQNMALNSGITPDGKEMGRAQIFQAEAAGIAPDVRMNPILLKPTSDRQAQVVLMGQVATSMDAVSYHQYKPRLREQILAVYQSLAGEYEALVLEGAGSPAEINLRDRDIVNMGMAEMAQCPVILVADIDRGGVFAAIYGTLALLQPQERARVKGVIINKFRGDVALLRSGIEQIEALTGCRCWALCHGLTWISRMRTASRCRPGNTIAPTGAISTSPWFTCRISPILPTLTPWRRSQTSGCAMSAIRRRWPTPTWSFSRAVKIPSAICAGCARAAWRTRSSRPRQRKVPLLGICGGYQMLGETIIDEVESGLGAQPGLGVLKTVTHFAQHKTTTQVQATLGSALPDWLADAARLRVSGYEIHMARRAARQAARRCCSCIKRGRQWTTGR
ncbi:cobyric acid synthase [Klebsiella pneumoniae]|uniref:Cobyric acid synthase n=1 Tax=Klebsiella pneumoniae TaxID=573 RepID=A0A378BBE9_KLEPN|nr:cobyric acid synthase [Klebsiella pneumoniae]